MWDLLKNNLSSWGEDNAAWPMKGKMYHLAFLLRFLNCMGCYIFGFFGYNFSWKISECIKSWPVFWSLKSSTLITMVIEGDLLYLSKGCIEKNTSYLAILFTSFSQSPIPFLSKDCYIVISTISIIFLTVIHWLKIDY